MKVIGITRRMDDLGRVVIPKEVRSLSELTRAIFWRLQVLTGACLCRNAAKPMGMNPSRREWKPKKRTRYLFSGIRIAWFIWFHFPKRQRNFAGGLKIWACWMKICGGRFVATMQREIFKRFAPFGAFLFVFFRGRTAQDGRGPIFSGSAVSTKYVRKCCAI